MLTKRFALAAMTSALAVLFAPPRATGDMSLRCVSEVMTSIYYNMDICGDAVDRDSQRTFSNLRSSLKEFINKNAEQDRDRMAKISTLEKRGSKAQKPGRIVRDGDYTLLNDILRHLLAPGQIASIQKRLESSEDPSEGDCL